MSDALKHAPVDPLHGHRPGLTAVMERAARVAALRLQLASSVAMAKWNPAQPRAKDGKWSAGGSFSAPQFGDQGDAVKRFKEDPQQRAFMKPLTQAEMTGQPAYKDNPEGYVLKNPSKPTDIDDNANPEDIAVYTDAAPAGPGLNGVPFESWAGPKGGDWSKVDGQGTFAEPPLPAAKGKRLGAGVIIEEPDGRVWTVSPLNQFGGYQNTLPKGGLEPGLNLRQTAIKEAWEESGLKVELTGYVGDFERTTSVARYYTARRVGGTPTDAHWETQAVNLVPRDDLGDHLSHHADKPLVAAMQGEGPAVQKAWCQWADCVDAGLINAGALEDPILKAVKGGKAWSKQLRVPAGMPTGGQWTTYGSGGWGSAHAMAGAPLALQKHGGVGPQADDANAKIAEIEAAANKGVVSSAALKQLGKPEPKQTYAQAVWQSAQEAHAYVVNGSFGPPAPKPAATAAVAAPKPAEPPAPVQSKPKPAQPPKGTADDPLKLDGWTKVGAKPGGSAAGAIYADADGTKWLVKAYGSQLMASNEVASSKLYNAMGVETPDMRLVDLGAAFPGKAKLGVASKFIDDAQKFDPQNPSHLKAAQADFGAHALVANWDAVGLSFDNLMMRDGKAVMIDPGGSLLMRAMGTPKGPAFGATVAEIDTLRDPKLNPSAAKVFGPMSESQLADSMTKASSALAKMEEDGTLAKTLAAYLPKSHVEEAALKMGGRIDDMKAKADELQAKQASVTAVDISTTGTTAAVFTHPDPFVQNLAQNQGAKDIAAFASMQAKLIDNAKLGIDKNSPSADFYYKKIDLMTQSAQGGSVDAVNAIAGWQPASAKAKLSANYGHFKSAAAHAVKLAQANAAANLKASGAKGDGSLATGGADVTPAVLNSVKAAAGLAPTDKVADSPAAVAMLTPAPAPPPKTVKERAAAAAAATGPAPVPPAFPKPKTLSSPSNPNVKLNALIAEAEKVAKDGAPGAAAKLKGMAAMIGGSNTFSKNGKEHIANLIAYTEANSGKVADMAPAAKKAAIDAGIEAAVAVGKKVKIKTIGGVKIKETTRVSQFDPNKLTEPPKFADWNGPGMGLSSKPAINADNDAKVSAMFAAAKANDLAALAKIDPGPSKHTQQYKATLTAELDAVGKEYTTTKLEDFNGVSDPAVAAAALGAAFKGKQSYDPSAEKFHAFVVAGTVGKEVPSALYATIPEKILTPAHKELKALANASFANANSAQVLSIKSYTGSGYITMNKELRYGQKGSKELETALKHAKNIEAAAIPLPAGLTLSRKLGAGTFQEWQAKVGSIITEPGITSTSVSPGVWSGSVWLKLKLADGVKGIYAGPGGANGALSSVSGENEVILPRNTKWIVANVKKADKSNPDSFFKDAATGTTIVEVIVVPNDPPVD